MCGRYLLKEVGEIDETVQRVFGFGLKLDRPRYNLAPSQLLPIVAADQEGAPRPTAMRWGLVPFWEKSPKPKVAPINARAEDVLNRPMFRQALQRRRCLVPADGFFEWRKLSEESKVPYVIRRRGGPWGHHDRSAGGRLRLSGDEEWAPPGEDVEFPKGIEALPRGVIVGEDEREHGPHHVHPGS